MRLFDVIFFIPKLFANKWFGRGTFIPPTPLPENPHDSIVLSPFITSIILPEHITAIVLPEHTTSVIPTLSPQSGSQKCR